MLSRLTEYAIVHVRNYVFAGEHISYELLSLV